MPADIQINTFVAQAKNRPARQALLLLSPSSRQSASADRLFVIAEINAERGESARLFGSQLFNHYQDCQNETENSENCFEKLIKWSNQHVEQFLETKKDRGCGAFMIGAVSDKKLFLTVSGTPAAHIYFKDGEIFRDLDLIQTYGGGERENACLPFFYTLISGELHIDNYVLASTAPLTDFLPPTRVTKIITEENGNTAVDALTKELNETTAHISVAGLLISRPGARKNILAPATSFTISTASIKRLIRQGQTTEKLMDASFAAKLKALLLPHLLPRRAKNELAMTTRAKKSRFSRNFPKSFPDFSVLLQSINQRGQQLLFKLGYCLVTCFQQTKKFLSASKKERRAIKNNICKIIAAFVSKQKIRWLRLQKKQQLIISVGAIGGILLVLNVAGLVARGANLRAQAVYTTQYNTIKEKMDVIESMIIYNNLLQARLEARNLQTLIADFPADTTKHKTTRVFFQKSLAELMSKLRQITAATPALVADFETQTRGEFTKLLTDGDWIAALGNDASAFTFNTATRETKPLASPLLASANAQTKRDAQNHIIAVEGKRLINVNLPANAITSLEILWQNNPPLIKAIGFYNNKLYVVDGAHGAITKHEPATQGFGKGVNWLKQPQNYLANASALTIDGAIYVGALNGDIYKFINGKGNRVSFDLLDPQLKTVTALYTTKDSPILFILDTAEKRVVLWDKKGTLKAQFTAPEFENAKDFAVNERAKEITVLSGAKVWKFKY